MSPRSNLLSLLGEFARYSKDVAIIQRRGYRSEKWTYGKIAEYSALCALELKTRGIHTGQRVLLWGPNSAEWLIAFWGCMLRGAIAVPMDASATPEFAIRVLRDADVALAFTSRLTPPHGLGVPTLTVEDLPDILSGPLLGNAVPELSRSPDFTGINFADQPITRTHIAEILYTSGTTAEPRGVALTHGNFLSNLEPIEKGLERYRKFERWFHPLRLVSLVPLSHVFGQFMALFVPPLLGATIVFEPSASPSEIIPTIKRERATALIAVPRMLEALKSDIQRCQQVSGMRLPFDVRYEKAKNRKFLRRAWIFQGVHFRFGWNFWAFISGGAALSADTELFFKRLGYAVVQGYGMTETASLISLNHPFRAAEGSVGKILPGRQFKLAEDGEILVRGENVSPGYWENGNIKPSTEQDWLPTGDLGELDQEGNLRFRGRKKNVIVTSAGLNIHPEDLEAALRNQASILDCVVVPITQGRSVEPCAVLLPQPSLKLDPEQSSTRDEICEQAVGAANQLLADYQKIRFWLLWPESDFPRTPTGKPRLGLISGRVSRLLLGAHKNEDDTTSSENPPLQDLLSQFLSRSGSAPHLEQKLNLSSLDRVELLSALEEKFRVELNETEFANANTVADLERLIHHPSSRKPEYNYPRWAQLEPIRWFRLLMYYSLVWPATQILGHPQITGRDHLRGVGGPVLVISNHITRRADIGLILLALPLRFRHRLAIAMGGETLQNMRQPPREWFVLRRWAYQLGYWLVTALFNVFPLPQLSGFRESFRFAGDSVDRGYSLLVFPEGTVNNSEDGQMAPFQGGISLLQQNLNIPVIPMRLDGVWQMKRQHRRFAQPGEVTVRIGAAIKFSPDAPREEIVRTLENAVRSL